MVVKICNNNQQLTVHVLLIFDHLRSYMFIVGCLSSCYYGQELSLCLDWFNPESFRMHSHKISHGRNHDTLAMAQASSYIIIKLLGDLDSDSEKYAQANHPFQIIIWEHSRMFKITSHITMSWFSSHSLVATIRCTLGISLVGPWTFELGIPTLNLLDAHGGQ